MKRRFLILLTVSVSLAGTTHAGVNRFISATGKWENGSQWSMGTPPSLADSSDVISNTGTCNIDATTVLSNALNGCLTISNLLVGAPLPVNTNTVNLLDAGLVTPLHVLSNC